jgi:choline dehydrogenase
MDQPNLTVLVHTQVTRLILSGTTVVGVEVIQGSQRMQIMADREVILSMGAINTPKVLMQSGIGPEEELRRHGIPVIQHLPGVGRNHQDHVSFGCILESNEPLAVGHGGSEATLYWKTDPTLKVPDVFHCQLEFPVATPETAHRGVPQNGWMVFAGLSHPKSRGSLHLTGPDARDQIRFEVAVVRDAVAGPKFPEGDGYMAALINFRFIANGVWTTDEVVRRLTKST